MLVVDPVSTKHLISLFSIFNFTIGSLQSEASFENLLIVPDCYLFQYSLLP